MVVGRNRRSAESGMMNGRLVMGRKGIGKLAGFGIALKMTVVTWQDGESTQFTLDVDELKGKDGQTEQVLIEGIIGSPPSDVESSSGTRVILEDLKHKTSLDVSALCESLGRRFSRTVRGAMKIYVNGDEIKEPALELEYRFPEDGGYEKEVLSDDSEITYYYAFTEKPIHSPQMRGFTVYARGKTAQAPPFFFDVEGTASGQHGTRYLTGVINADFIDEGNDDSDLISTDRQEIDWEDEWARELYEWGQRLTRKALIERVDRKGEEIEKEVAQDERFKSRIERLDESSQKQVSKFLKALGGADTDAEHVFPLADSLIRAFEYRHFHDVISHIEAASRDPEQLSLL